MNDVPVSGKDLKLLRTAADVRLIDLATAMGIQPSGVSALESRRIVTDKARSRYVAALATFATSDDARSGQGAA